MRNRYIGGIKNLLFFIFFGNPATVLVLNFLRFSMLDDSGYLSFEVLKMLKNNIF